MCTDTHVSRRLSGHNYIGHNYIGHNYIDHNYTFVPDAVSQACGEELGRSDSKYFWQLFGACRLSGMRRGARQERLEGDGLL